MVFEVVGSHSAINQVKVSFFCICHHAIVMPFGKYLAILTPNILVPNAFFTRLKIPCLVFVRFSEIPKCLPFRFFLCSKYLLLSLIRSKIDNSRPNFLVFHLPNFFRLGKYFSLSFQTNLVRAINVLQA